MSERYYLTIDPGIEGTGYAVWNADAWEACEPPVLEGSLFASRRKGDGIDFVTKSDRLLLKLKNLLTGYPPEKCWCEFPKLMESNYAATAGGNIFKLAYFVGRISQLCYDHGCEFIAVDVNDWKGTMGKPAVDVRIARRLNGAKYSNHASDAVGIGLWAKGCWKDGNGTTKTRLPTRKAEGATIIRRRVAAVRTRHG